MTKVSKRTFSLPAEQAAYIDAKVESGAYVSSSEVIRAGLRALQEPDAAVERWLQDEVAPVYDAMKANPGASLRQSPSSPKRAPAMPRNARRVVEASSCCLRTGHRRHGAALVCKPDERR